MISALPFLRRFTSRAPDVPWAEGTEAELAVVAQVQDKAGKNAFVEIVHRHQAAVYAVAYGVTGRLAVMEDIPQETFFYAWKNMTSLRE